MQTGMLVRTRSVAILLVAATSSGIAVVQDYDVTQSIVLNGVVSRVISPPASQHVYLVIDALETNGAIQKWAIEGSSAAALARAGWKLGFGGTVNPGDEVSIIAFHLSTNANSTQRLPISAPEQIFELARAGRLVRGTEITFANGKTLTFGVNP